LNVVTKFDDQGIMFGSRLRQRFFLQIVFLWAVTRYCRRIPMFQKNIMPPLSGQKCPER
jgi:hypothetical protein